MNPENIASGLRNMVDDIEGLGAGPLTVDAALLRQAIAALTPPKVSDTTQRLIDLLIERDMVGRAKYGVTLDRTDLTRDQWLQHMVEELLDGAGYALAAQRSQVNP